MRRQRFVVVAMLAGLATVVCVSLSGCGTASPAAGHGTLVRVGTSPVSGYARRLLALIAMPAGAAPDKSAPLGELSLPRGSGSTSEGGPLVSELDLYPIAHLPADAADAEVYVTAAPLGGGRTAVGGFAVVVPQPPRPAVERVPLLGVTAVVSWQSRPGGAPEQTKLGGPQARALAVNFDALVRDTDGPIACQGEASSDFPNGVTVNFQAGSHTWRASFGDCGGIGVTRHGARLPALDFFDDGGAHQEFTSDLRADGIRLPWQSRPTSPTRK